MSGSAVLFGVVVVVTVGLLVAVWLEVPFSNGPPEWEWAFQTADPRTLWVPAVFGLALLAACLLKIPALSSTGKLALLLLVGWLFTMALVSSRTGGLNLVLRTLASRHTFSYVYDASSIASVPELLDEYPRVSARLSMHSRTHPPGPLLVILALNKLGSSIEPLLGSLTEEGPLKVAADALRREAQRARIRRRPVPQHPTSPVTVVLLAVLLPTLSVLAVWPLYLMIRGVGWSAEAALLAVGLWLLVPARSLFTPSLDQAVPVFALTAFWLASSAGAWRGAAAGLFLGLCCFLSYGYLPLVALVLVCAWPGGGRQAALRWGSILVGLTFPWLLVTIFAGYDPWQSFTAALLEHRGMALATRSYWTWLLYNPFDYALLLGLPVALLSVAPLLERPHTTPETGRALLLPVWWALFLLLVVSGSVRGEGGRIWLALMPFSCAFAGGFLGRGWHLGSRGVAVIFVLQLCCVLTLAAKMSFMV